MVTLGISLCLTFDLAAVQLLIHRCEITSALQISSVECVWKPSWVMLLCDWGWHGSLVRLRSTVPWKSLSVLLCEPERPVSLATSVCHHCKQQQGPHVALKQHAGSLLDDGRVVTMATVLTDKMEGLVGVGSICNRPVLLERPQMCVYIPSPPSGFRPRVCKSVTSLAVIHLQPLPF